MSLSKNIEPPGHNGDHLNTGMQTLRVPIDDREQLTGPMTVIVSGVGRSGTSMLAKVLDALGIWMGKTNGLAVFEDQDFNRALFQMDYNRVRQLISEYDAAHQRWGVKFPSLQNHIFPPHLNYFRRPRLIVVMRDVAATANRSYVSDAQKRPFEVALREVSKQYFDMVDFICDAQCPTLVVSYEKFIAFPENGINAMAKFCGISVTSETNRRALLAIEPNNPNYISLFHTKFRGNFDSVKRGHAIGWCAEDSSDDPVEVELVADGKVIATTMADIFRADLLAAEIGAGCHGFRFDLSRLGLNDSVILEVRTAGREYTVNRSGRRLRDFPDR